MRHEFKTCRCNSTGAFRIAVSLPANSNSGARTFNGWLPTTPRGGTKPTNAAAVWKVNRPDVHTMWIIAAHADEPSPLGVPAHATSNQLDRVARMLDAGGSYADARDLRLLAWVSCGAGV